MSDLNEVMATNNASHAIVVFFTNKTSNSYENILKEPQAFN